MTLVDNDGSVHFTPPTPAFPRPSIPLGDLVYRLGWLPPGVPAEAVLSLDVSKWTHDANDGESSYDRIRWAGCTVVLHVRKEEIRAMMAAVLPLDGAEFGYEVTAAQVPTDPPIERVVVALAGVGWISLRGLTPDAWDIPALAAEIIAARVPPVVDSDGRTAVDSDHVGA